jgi:hypothetical protein
LGHKPNLSLTFKPSISPHNGRTQLSSLRRGKKSVSFPAISEENGDFGSSGTLIANIYK